MCSIFLYKKLKLWYNIGHDTYYIQNAHGDVVNLTDKDGKVTKSYRYDAFGVEKNIDDNDTNAFRYCGEYYDTESGTIYLRARYYDPAIGRFISRDSYPGKNEDPLSLNLYTYCHNNPILAIDPSGYFILTAMLIGATAGTIIGGTIGGTAAYKSAKEEGKTGSDLFKSTVVGVGKGAVVGGVGGGLIGATGVVVAAYGAGSVAGTTMITGTATISGKATEVASLQIKKSRKENKSGWQVTNNCIHSMFNNGGKVVGFTPLTKAGSTSAIYLYKDITKHKVVPLRTDEYLKSKGGKMFSYGFAVTTWGHTAYSTLSKDPEKRARRRGYKLRWWRYFSIFY